MNEQIRVTLPDGRIVAADVIRYEEPSTLCPDVKCARVVIDNKDCYAVAMEGSEEWPSDGISIYVLTGRTYFP